MDLSYNIVISIPFAMESLPSVPDFLISCLFHIFFLKRTYIHK